MLRRACLEDVAAMHAIFSDPRAMRYWSRPPHTDPAQTADWLAGMIAAPPDQADDYIVEMEGRVVGKAGCWRVPEVGFIFHPEVWGQGIAGRALRAVLPVLFARFPVPALVAEADPRNARCLRLLGRLGFQETGRQARACLVGEEWCDSVTFALARPDDGVPAPPVDAHVSVIRA
jgi:RimJ/RimL family protein N-acetyltransferase